jgi:glycosyltransferase involved in cell wall biosynthesis
LNITILKKINTLSDNQNKKVSFIIPCKDEEKNIPLFKNQINNSNENFEFLFGDDNSSDQTRNEIEKIKNEIKNKEIKSYEGPGTCKAQNVYKGIEFANGQIIVIYDADLTVSFEDINFAINILNNSNADFINCTRMIYPQKEGAMKKFNFLGNSFFAFLFSVLFKKKITDTLCGTKIFYKKDWFKIKKDISNWGAKDLWGDFDLLIGAYKNNLKILEVPVTYFERSEGETKMTNVITNASRMFWIVIYSFYKLRLRD